MKSNLLVIRGVLELFVGIFLVLSETLIQVPKGMRYTLGAGTLYYGLATTLEAIVLMVAGLFLLQDVRGLWSRRRSRPLVQIV